MFFGMFGSIFLLAQFFQTVQGYSPLGAGLRILPWTLAPMFIAPLAGALSDRIPPKLIIGTGLAMQSVALAWIGLVSTPTVPYSSLIAPFIVAGVGMALFFAPVANVVLSAVRPEQEGQASGANNAIRELGGVFGVAVLAAVFAHVGGYESNAGVQRRHEHRGARRRRRRRGRRGRGVRDTRPAERREMAPARRRAAGGGRVTGTENRTPWTVGHPTVAGARPCQPGITDDFRPGRPVFGDIDSTARD